MDTLRTIIQIHGACTARAMLEEAIKQEHKELEARLKDINLYMSGQVEVGVITQMEDKISSIEEQLSVKQPTAKGEQRAAEAAKRAALVAVGINPRDLLTRENLQTWISQGKSFSQIAREEVGLRQEEISAAVRQLGLQQEQPKAKKPSTSQNQIISVKKEE